MRNFLLMLSEPQHMSRHRRLCITRPLQLHPLGYLQLISDTISREKYEALCRTGRLQVIKLHFVIVVWTFAYNELHYKSTFTCTFTCIFLTSKSTSLESREVIVIVIVQRTFMKQYGSKVTKVILCTKY